MNEGTGFGFFTRTDLLTAQNKLKRAVKKSSEALPVEVLHQRECAACPLNAAPLRSPKLLPTGAANPSIFVLGETPSADEDAAGKHGVGKGLRLLQSELQSRFSGKVRWSNSIRCHAKDEKGLLRPPTQVEAECCRPRGVNDIVATRPKVIFSLGAVPLEWLQPAATGGISKWRGRRIPVRVGTHTAWLYPLLHPDFVARVMEQKFGEGNKDQFGSEWHRVFQADVRRALAEFDTLPDPRVWTEEELTQDSLLLRGGPGELERLRTVLARMATEPALAVDIETSRLRTYEAGGDFVSAALSGLRGTLAVALDHPQAGWGSQLPLVQQVVRDFLLSYQGLLVCQNTAYEVEWFAHRWGPSFLRGPVWEDTMLQAYVLDERKYTHSLNFLSTAILGLPIKELSEVDVKRLRSEDLQKVLRYNALDARGTLLIWNEQVDRVHKEGLDGIYREHLRRIPTVVATQIAGVPTDQEAVTRIGEQLGKEAASIKKQISELPVVRSFEAQFGRFNPASTTDVAKMMRDFLKRKEGQRGKGYTTDEEALEKMKDLPLAKMILQLRSVEKRKSTYIDPLLPGHEKSVLYPDSLLHTTYNTTFAETGRLTSEGPNLQNFPKREHRQVRAVVAAPPDFFLVAADYGQIEARVLAMGSKDPRYVRSMWDRHDIHMDWAVKIADLWPAVLDPFVLRGLDDAKVMKEFRSVVKNAFVFPAFYGAGLKSISENLGVPFDTLQPLFREFWQDHHGVKRWQQEQQDLYQRRGWVSTFTGRRRRGPLTTTMVLNTPIQGTASDIVIDAMNRLSERSEAEGWPALQARMNIHDDLTFLVPASELDSAIEAIVMTMLETSHFPWINVPISVEVEVGRNWYEMRKVGDFFSDELAA